MVPHYFYDAEGIVKLEGFPIHKRWADPYVDPSTDERRLILTEQERMERGMRDTVYAAWLKQFAGYGIRGKQMMWQAVRITDTEHQFASNTDWWTDYIDCVFRVFQEPHTAYSPRMEQHIQYYILCPEDTFLVHCYNRFKEGHPYPKRDSFKWLPKEPEFRKMLMVPQQCAPHMRHETTGGVLPEGL